MSQAKPSMSAATQVAKPTTKSKRDLNRPRLPTEVEANLLLIEEERERCNQDMEHMTEQFAQLTLDVRGERRDRGIDTPAYGVSIVSIVDE